jgi:single stranded DNA-binding protein (ssb)
MNSIRNQVNLIGHLGMDAEVIKFENGSTKVNARIATSESYKNKKGERVDETQWHNLIAWGKTAEIMGMYFKKGKQVAVSGKLCHRTYQDKEGKDRRITEIQVNEFTFLDKKEAN